MSGTSFSLHHITEIFGNPSDLEIVVIQEDGKFAFGVFRGPEGEFKPILISNAFAKELEEAVIKVGSVLESIQAAAANTFNVEIEEPPEDPSLCHVLSRFSFLSKDLIQRIMVELRQNHKVSTCKIVTTVG